MTPLCLLDLLNGDIKVPVELVVGPERLFEFLAGHDFARSLDQRL